MKQYIYRSMFLLLLLLVAKTSAYAQYGFGTNKPDASAAVDMTSTTKGFLPPRMTRDQILAIPSPEEGMMVYNTTVGCLAYYAKGAFNCTSTPPLKCGDEMTVNHSTTKGAPENATITYGTVSYVGKCWITKNLGAAAQATSFSDASDDRVGWYWQFNRSQGFKKAGSVYTPSSNWNSSGDPGLSGWIQDNDPCALLIGLGWRIPTQAEWDLANSTGNWTIAAQNANSVLMNLNGAGDMNPGTGVFETIGTRGLYWSSSVTTTPGSSWYMNIGSDPGVKTNGALNAYGFPLRCLRD